jgi:hypothetical protein
VRHPCKSFAGFARLGSAAADEAARPPRPAPRIAPIARGCRVDSTANVCSTEFGNGRRAWLDSGDTIDTNELTIAEHERRIDGVVQITDFLISLFVLQAHQIAACSLQRR